MLHVLTLQRMVTLLAPRESAWTSAKGASCDTVCGAKTTSHAAVRKITSVGSFLRANRAMGLRARDMLKSKLIDDSTPGKCDAYARSATGDLFAPKAQRRPGSSVLHCTYGGESSDPTRAFVGTSTDQWRLCCCTDTSTTPPEDASTACPVVTADCDQDEYMALVTTEGAAKEGICVRLTSATCPHGHYADTSSKRCIACKPGKYARQEGGTSESACVSCPAGSYGAEEAQTSEASGCTECMQGKTSLAGAKQCVTPLGGVGWVLGPPLWNCDRVCAAGGGGTCRVDRQQTITDQEQFEGVMTAVRAERGDGSDVNFDGLCSVIDSDSARRLGETPSRSSDGRCRVVGTYSLCGASEASGSQNERMCCCVDEGELILFTVTFRPNPAHNLTRSP